MLCQGIDIRLFSRSYVICAAFFRFHREYVRAHDIAYINEISSLFSVPINYRGLVLKNFRAEYRHHSGLPFVVLPWPVYIGKTECYIRNVKYLMVIMQITLNGKFRASIGGNGIFPFIFARWYIFCVTIDGAAA